MAIAKGAFISTLRSPSSVAFSLGFPLLFIFGFIFLDTSQDLTIKVGYDAMADTSNVIFQKINNISGIVIERKTVPELEHDIKHNTLEAILNIDAEKNVINIAAPDFVNAQHLEVLHTLLQSALTEQKTQAVTVSQSLQLLPGRQNKTIDFVLPGQLGFALLGASVFGIAFLFFNLRQELVLKRFFATPITKTNILLGGALSHAIFQLIAANIVILVGVIFLDFTLVHGFWTYFQIMVLCFMTLIVFMGSGFMISGMAKSSAAIPALANIYTLPQYILAGTFFPIDKFPHWLQTISKLLPLTHFNDAMRYISFDGASLADCWFPILVIVLWGIFFYTLAVRFFKWE